jgi:hypothetical protein
MKRAVLVVGPESSGTRLWTEIVCGMGYAGGWGHQQQWDAEIPLTKERIVHRRSLPHDGEWPDMEALLERWTSAGFEVWWLVCCRDWHAMTHSQVGQHVPDLATADKNCRDAYTEIMGSMDCRGPWRMVTYESLIVNSDQVIKSLAEWLGAGTPPDASIYDGNAKWYSEQGVSP